MGLILKTGAVLSGNVALTSDGVQEVRPPQWDNPVVLGSMSGVYGTTSRILLDGTEVTDGTILFNEPSSENTSIWANGVTLGSMSGVYGSTSRLLLDGTEVTGGTILFNELSSTSTSIWANSVILGSMSGVYGSTSKLLLDGTEVTGGTTLDGFAEPDDSIWANPVVLGSMSGVYGITSKLLLDGTEVTDGTVLDGFSEPDDSVWANPVVLGSMSGVYGSTSQILITISEVQFSGEHVETIQMTEGDTFTLNAAELNMGIHSTSFTVDKVTTMEMHLWGAAGGSTKMNTAGPGGRGGYSRGTYVFYPEVEYHVVVGGGGEGGYQDPANNDAYGAYSTGGGRTELSTADQYDGAGGGGYTGVFAGSVSHGSAIIIAGGGGGGSGIPAQGGFGGGNSGDPGYGGEWSGTGGTQTSGGSGGTGSSAGFSGGPLQGGTGGGWSAGGGGGYFGGGGGGSVSNVRGTGGGGSGYIDASLTDSYTGYWTTNEYHTNNAGTANLLGKQGRGGLLVFRKVAA